MAHPRGLRRSRTHALSVVRRDRDAPRTRLEVEERRAQVLDVALDLFVRSSYDEVSMDDVARAAGISKGLVFHYFPTKRELYAATVERATADLVSRVLAAKGGSPLGDLVAAIDAYLDYVDSRALAFVGLMRSGVGSDPEVAAIVDRARDLLVTELVSEMPITVTPLVSAALRGWIGFVEAISLDWAHENLAHKSQGQKNQAKKNQAKQNQAKQNQGSAVDRRTLRDLCVSVLVATVQAASGTNLASVSAAR